MKIFPLMYKNSRLRYLAIVYAEHLLWIISEIPLTAALVDAKAITRAHNAVRKLVAEARAQEHWLNVYERKRGRKLILGPLISSMRRRCECCYEAEQRFNSNIYSLPRSGTLTTEQQTAITNEAQWIRSKFK